MEDEKAGRLGLAAGHRLASVVEALVSRGSKPSLADLRQGFAASKNSACLESMLRVYHRPCDALHLNAYGAVLCTACRTGCEENIECLLRWLRREEALDDLYCCKMWTGFGPLERGSPLAHAAAEGHLHLLRRLLDEAQPLRNGEMHPVPGPGHGHAPLGNGGPHAGPRPGPGNGYASLLADMLSGASSRPGNAAVVRELLSRGADPTGHSDPDTVCPLYDACYDGCRDNAAPLLRWLVDHGRQGVLLEVEAGNDNSPLMAACHRNHPGLVADILRVVPRLTPFQWKQLLWLNGYVPSSRVLSALLLSKHGGGAEHAAEFPALYLEAFHLAVQKGCLDQVRIYMEWLRRPGSPAEALSKRGSLGKHARQIAQDLEDRGQRRDMLALLQQYSPDKDDESKGDAVLPHGPTAWRSKHDTHLSAGPERCDARHATANGAAAAADMAPGSCSLNAGGAAAAATAPGPRSDLEGLAAAAATWDGWSPMQEGEAGAKEEQEEAGPLRRRLFRSPLDTGAPPPKRLRSLSELQLGVAAAGTGQAEGASPQPVGFVPRVGCAGKKQCAVGAVQPGTPTASKKPSRPEWALGTALGRPASSSLGSAGKRMPHAVAATAAIAAAATSASAVPPPVSAAAARMLAARAADGLVAAAAQLPVAWPCPPPSPPRPSATPPAVALTPQPPRRRAALSPLAPAAAAAFLTPAAAAAVAAAAAAVAASNSNGASAGVHKSPPSSSRGDSAPPVSSSPADAVPGEAADSEPRAPSSCCRVEVHYPSCRDEAAAAVRPSACASRLNLRDVPQDRVQASFALVRAELRRALARPGSRWRLARTAQQLEQRSLPSPSLPLQAAAPSGGGAGTAAAAAAMMAAAAAPLYRLECHLQLVAFEPGEADGDDGMVAAYDEVEDIATGLMMALEKQRGASGV